jgi:predicted transcriptional regulator
MHVLVRRLQRAGVYGRGGVYARAWTVCVNEAEVVGVAKAHAVRLDEDTTEWLDRYAEERGTDKGTILRSAIESFRDDCERGVPELRQKAREQASYSGRSDDRGVGDCPERGEGLGHVWAGVKASGDSRNPCRFCGTPGRQARDAQGRPVGEPGFFEKATQGRVDVLGDLRTPDSIAMRKPKGK